MTFESGKWDEYMSSTPENQKSFTTEHENFCSIGAFVDFNVFFIALNKNLIEQRYINQ